MADIKTIPIGSKIFVFNPVRKGDLKMEESVCYGSYLNKNEGELWYYARTESYPAYACAETKEELMEKMLAFDSYRKELAECDQKVQGLYRELRKEYLFPEYSIDEIAKTTENANESKRK